MPPTVVLGLDDIQYIAHVESVAFGPQVCETNSGRDPFPQFLKRAPLPKGLPAVPDVTVKPKKQDCYSPIDFRIGGYISVYGRPFFIYDCDDFTRFFYKESMGYDPATMEAIVVDEPIPAIPKAPLPQLGTLSPWLLGSLNDDENELMKMMPRPPKKNFARLMNKDKTILRFKCRIVERRGSTLSNADKDRRFVLSYFVADDTIGIFEPPVRNSGIIGGKFLERQKVYAPNTRVAYAESDLYVGNVLDIFNRNFELLDADEFTFQYMENNKHIYIRSDPIVAAKQLWEDICDKEDDFRSLFIEFDKDGSGALTADILHEVAIKMGMKMAKKQTIITLIRDTKLKFKGQVTFDNLLEVVKSAASGSPLSRPRTHENA